MDRITYVDLTSAISAIQEARRWLRDGEAEQAMKHINLAEKELQMLVKLQEEEQKES